MTQVKGLDRLLRQIRAIPELQRQAAAEALALGADEMVAAIKRAVPKRGGKGPHLEGTIKWSVTGQENAAGSGSKAQLAAARGDRGLSLTITEGDEKAYWAYWVEFGTKPGTKGERVTDKSGRTRIVQRNHPGTPAEPHFYPTIRAQKARVKARVVRSANKAAKAVAGVK